MEVRNKYVSQGRGHAMNCLLCDLMWSLCLELFSPPEVCARPPVPTKRCSFTYRRQWFVFSEVQQHTEDNLPIVSDFQLIKGLGTYKSSWKFLPGEKMKVQMESNHNSVKEQRNATSCFCFTQFLATENPHYTRGRGKASDPVGETESSKKNPAIWNVTTLSCMLEPSFEVSLLELGSVSYATPDEKGN